MSFAVAHFSTECIRVTLNIQSTRLVVRKLTKMSEYIYPALTDEIKTTSSRVVFRTSPSFLVISCRWAWRRGRGVAMTLDRAAFRTHSPDECRPTTCNPILGWKTTTGAPAARKSHAENRSIARRRLFTVIYN